MPKAKSITQRKRSYRVKIIEFGKTDVLPAYMPSQQREAITNQWFKHCIIQMAFANFPFLVSQPDK